MNGFRQHILLTPFIKTKAQDYALGVFGFTRHLEYILLYESVWKIGGTSSTLS
jgi:hypothetical protein